jgi:hypothetical protein
MGQGREPIFLVLNGGLGNYSISNDTATVENRPQISKYNSSILNYQPNGKQFEAFDSSMGNITNY